MGYGFAPRRPHGDGAPRVRERWRHLYPVFELSAFDTHEPSDVDGVKVHLASAHLVQTESTMHVFFPREVRAFVVSVRSLSS